MKSRNPRKKTAAVRGMMPGKHEICMLRSARGSTRRTLIEIPCLISSWPVDQARSFLRKIELMLVEKRKILRPWFIFPWRQTCLFKYVRCILRLQHTAAAEGIVQMISSLRSLSHILIPSQSCFISIPTTSPGICALLTLTLAGLVEQPSLLHGERINGV